MLEIKDITQEEIVNFFTNDPALAYMGLSDETLYMLYNKIEFDFAAKSIVKGLFLNDELIFITKYEFFTNTSLNIHAYLSSKLQGEGIFEKVDAIFIPWFRENYPNVKKLINMCPAPCTHIAHTVKKYGFKQEGHIKKCIRWRKDLVDLYIFGLEI